MFQKGLAPILIILFIIVSILFIPIPKYAVESNCGSLTMEGVYNNVCFPPEPDAPKVLVWTPSIAEQLYLKFTTSSRVPVETKLDPIQLDETSNWKTYTNAEYRYSIKYPDFLSHSSSLYNGSDGGVVKVDNFVGKEDISITINIYKDGTHPEIRSLLDSIGTQNITINNQQVRKAVTQQGYQITVGPFRNESINTNYIFVYLGRANSSDPSILDKMLATFKYTQ